MARKKKKGYKKKRGVPAEIRRCAAKLGRRGGKKKRRKK